LRVLRFEHFGPGVVHGISTRLGGVSEPPYATLNLGGGVKDDPDRVRQNRNVFLERLGHRPASTAGVRQVHGNQVVVARRGDANWDTVPASPPIAEADGLVTNEPGLAVAVVAADCVPILFWDPLKRAASAAHAGWRGTVAGIAASTIKAMVETFDSRPSDIRAGIGPGIGPCCYEIDAAVVEPLQAALPDVAERVVTAGRPDHWMLDLPEANRLQLLAAGLREEHIEVMDLCTSCNTDLLYSQRVEGYPCGRFAAAIALAG